MPKRLIVCCDGTWARPEHETNIAWIAAHCRQDHTEQIPQEVCYLKGLGTDPGERVLGGALGYGLSRTVREAYGFVREKWQPGDELFLFGFSRGAYAARSLAGFIGLVGWLDDPDWIDRAYQWYRLSRVPPDHRSMFPIAHFLEQSVRQRSKHRIGVTFLGVFDTVGALGLPLFPGEDLHGIEAFHDTGLGAHIERAYHALAIDEHLEAFLPTVWTTVPRGTIAEQVWFAGGHGEVGGGHSGAEDNRTLAKVPLLWMMEKATEAGLVLKPGALADLQAEADPLAPQHDAPPMVRPEVSAIIPKVDRQVPETAIVHPAVHQRCGKEVEIRGIDGARRPKTVYQPANLPAGTATGHQR